MNARERTAIEVTVLTDAMHLAGSYDQLNGPSLASMETSAPRIPAWSPSCTSITRTEKPLRSPQRWYMRSSISAQSWLSTPPAPALIESMADAPS